VENFTPLDELVASLPLDQQHEVAETVYQFCKRNDKAQELVQWELKKEIEHTGTRRKRILCIARVSMETCHCVGYPGCSGDSIATL
jgi:hypothetical protein